MARSGNDPDKSQTLIGHLTDLRKRVIVCLICLLVAFLAAFSFAAEIYELLAHQLLNVLAQNGIATHKLIYTHLTEGFTTYARLALHTALIGTFPIILAQTYFFIAPGLYEKEKKWIRPYLFFSPTLFLIGMLVSYYIVMPAAWKFFLTFENNKIPIILEPKISEYLTLTTELMVGFGFAFQLPVVLTILTRLELVRASTLIKYEKHAIVFIFIIAAILTPPDVISQILLAIPMTLLYDLSVRICKYFEKTKRVRDQVDRRKSDSV